MPLVPVDIPAGIAAELPLYASAGSWHDSDKIRFENGIAYTWRGWNTLAEGKLSGKTRGVATWALLDGQQMAAFGTHKKLYVLRSGELTDITPIRSSGTAAADPITTSSGTSTVSFALTGHGAQIGDAVRISSATAVGGLDANGEWEITAVPNADEFEFEHTGVATSTATGGGASVDYEFDIHAGPADGFLGLGWGAGGWGEETWGTARSPSATAPFRVEPRLWFLHPVGEDLVASHTDGAFYYWDASAGLGLRAVALGGGSPAKCKFSLYSAYERALMAFGVNDDPFLMMVSDAGSLTNWTVSPGVTTADSRRVVEGTGFKCAVVRHDEVLFWTSIALWSYRLSVTATQTHSARRVRAVEPPISPRAAIAAHGDEIWWLGAKQIYRYTGVIQEMPFSVCRRFNRQVDRLQMQKTFAATDIRTNQVFFIYPAISDDVAECNSYIKVNYLDLVPDAGTIDRTAWVDADTFDYPIAVGPDGTIYRHDAGGTLAPTVNMTFWAYDYPMSGSRRRQDGPYSISSATESLCRKFRGRHLQMRISGQMLCGGETHDWFIETGIFDMGDGNEIMACSRIVPDFEFQENLDDIAIGRFRFNIRPDGAEE